MDVSTPLGIHPELFLRVGQVTFNKKRPENSGRFLLNVKYY